MEIATAMQSTVLFGTTFLKNPTDPNLSVLNLNEGEGWVPYYPQRQIANILDFGYDIENSVLRPTHPADIIVMVWPRQTGKTEGVTSVIASLLCRYPRALIGVVSNNEENAKFLVNRIYNFLLYSPFADMIELRKTDRIKMKNGAMVMSFGQTDNIRGYPFWWIFCDEAAQFPDALLDGAIIPTVRAAGAFKKWKTPSIILLSTPRGPVGRFFDYYSRGLQLRDIGCRVCGNKVPIKDPIYRTIQFPTLQMPALPNCAKCGENNYEYVSNKIITVTLDPWDHPAFTVPEIKDELERRGNTPLARQELLGEIITDNTGVFSRMMLESNQDPDIKNLPKPNPAHRYVLGVDFGKMHDATVISMGHQELSKIIQDYIEYHPSEGGGMEYAEIRWHVMRLVAIYQPTYLVPDATGIGDPIVEQLILDIKLLKTVGLSITYVKNGGTIEKFIPPVYNLPTRVYNNKTNRLGFVFDYQSKIDLIDNLINLFEKNLITIGSEFPYEALTILWKELINFGYTYSDSNRIVYGTQRDHDDTVIALALMCWGCRMRPYYNTSAVIGGRDHFVL